MNLIPHRLDRLLRGPSLGMLCVAAIALVEVPHVAACSPGHHPAGVTNILPSGAEHPANAAIVFRGGMLYADRLEATIDGIPATVGIDPRLSQRYPPDDAYLLMAIRLTPEPVPGQMVHVSGNPCTPWGVSVACAEVDVSYVAGARDVTAPPAPTGWWDFRPNPVLGSGPFTPDSCGRLPVAGAVILHAELPTPAVGPEDVALLRARVFPRPGGTRSAQQVTEAATMYVDTTIVVDVGQVGVDSDPSGLCVEFEVVDLAGNVSTSVRVCEACRVGSSDLCFPAERHCPDHLAPESPDEECMSEAVSDGGVSDAGASDAGAPDAGVSDAGVSDAGASDAGAPDAGAPDGSAPDGGLPEMDAGPRGDVAGGMACSYAHASSPGGASESAWLALALLAFTWIRRGRR